ncbi:ankyrin repeat domain-containing protein 13C isoform X2 [Cephus cinctus]|uniref:Ankyrin repeat domain-containing protein 13C isoform X2 n=1 Tax=Cephus cinctus TaxID=211228 RepID=A0AAJ7BGI7_CEPCN|nr:ankyrin repeat domain-containing protein 13C isoform X2 [Cephus cinctus]
MADASAKDQYPLHRCIFEGDIKGLSLLIRTHDVSEKDNQGNTPLHLAVMLGRKEFVQLLLAHGASVKIKNLAGWSPLAEAISYGDRQTISSLVRKLKQQAREQMEERRPNLVTALRQMGDFYMELKWDFQSWVPLVSRILPSDICRIHKSGASIRMDTTLVDFNDMRWERGDISFIFNGDQKPSKSLTVLDNKAKLYQRVKYEETELEIEDEIDIRMSSDIMAVQMSTKGITFSRAQTGWIFREDKREMVGPFQADFYQINGMVLESRKRREHLSEEDLQKNKAIMESLTKGSSQGFTNGEPPLRRASLNPPPESSITWEEYLAASPGECPLLGRCHVYKESSKSFKATVAMSPDFPLTVGMLLNVLEVIAPFKHFSKLRQFVLMKLPPGFPVKIDIPILPTVTAKITFQEFAFRNDIDPELFQVPSDYFEDPMRDYGAYLTMMPVLHTASSL